VALDFTILDGTGAPEQSVPIGVQAHHELLVAARDADLPLLLRVSDYYADADVRYEIAEVPQLAAELQKLESNQNCSDLVRQSARAIRQMCSHAAARGKPIDVIAD